MTTPDSQTDNSVWTQAVVFLENYRLPVTLLIIGIILIGIGVLVIKSSEEVKNSKIEVIGNTNDLTPNRDIVVEITGAVENPGVYTFKEGSRINDLLITAGGLAADADREWSDKNLNKAAKLTDGQKIYIPNRGDQSDVLSAKNNGGIKIYQGGNFNLININTSNQKALEDLPGIGPVYAQSIIEHRPYSTAEELVTNGILKKNVYEKIKEKITVY